jgi:murein DD-endopeptidase MepM/ murein hydrolase activator NlpD
MQNNNTRENSLTPSRFILTGALILLTILVGILLLEYHFFYNETRKLIALQTQYRLYINDLQQQDPDEIDVESDGARDSSRGSNWGVRGDDFIVVNRDPEYLKDSMITYLKECQLAGLLPHVNLQEWHDYTGRINVAARSALNMRKQPKQARRTKRYVTRKPKKYRVAPASNSFFSWPIDSDQFWVSSHFGPRKKPDGSWGIHHGIDLASIKGTPVKAAASGTVSESRSAKTGYGNSIVLHHGNRYKTRYAHLDRIFVKQGQSVIRGQVIGTVGATGTIRKKGKDGSHLHFEVYTYNGWIPAYAGMTSKKG